MAAPVQTDAQKQAAYTDAGLTATQQTTVNSGNGYVGPTNAPTTTVAPTETPTTTESDTGDYYSRYTPDEKAAVSTLSTPVVAQTVDQIQASKTAAAQDQINALNKHYDDLLNEQRIVNEGRSRGTSSVNTLTGLAGSSEANVTTDKTAALNEQDNEKIQNERSAALQGIMSEIRSSAVQEAQQSRLEARQSASDILDLRTKRQTDAVTQVKNLSMSGVTAEGLKATDPTSYQYLVNNVGGEDQLKAQLIINRPQNELVGTPTRVGDHYVQMYKNPLTGQVTAESIQIPGGLPANYSTFQKMGDNLVAIPDGWNGDVSQLKTIAGQPSASDKVDMAYKQAETAKIYNDIKGTQSSGNAANNPVIATILGSGKFTKDQAAAITSAINNGQDPATVIKNQAKNIMGQTEATKVTSYEATLSAMDDIDKNLDAYYAAGGKTGLINGTFEKTINSLGSVSDPKLVSLATQLALSLQSYRNAISGTAYSDQEGKDIASVFPGINKSSGLNQAIIDGRKKGTQATIDGIYKSTLGSAYDDLKKGDTSDASAPVEKPAAGVTTQINGHTYRSDGAQWVLVQ